MSVSDWIFNRYNKHYRRTAQKRAKASPRYRELEQSRGPRGMVTWGTMKEMRAIESEYSPENKIHAAWYWWQEHRIFYRDIKFFIQRGRRGWADVDAWNLYSYLQRVIPDSVAELRRQAHGYPGYGEADTFEKWEAILVEIEDGFRNYAAMDKLGPAYHYTDKGKIALAEDEAKLCRSLELMGQWWPNLWD